VHAMEENEWFHEGLRGCCKVNACTSSYAGRPVVVSQTLGPNTWPLDATG
jgi:hypothetical protein